jgi:hypothetical protein
MLAKHCASLLLVATALSLSVFSAAAAGPEQHRRITGPVVYRSHHPHYRALPLERPATLLANPALAADPMLVDGNGHTLVFDTTSRLQKEWNAYVKVHGIKRGGFIYTPYSAKFRRGGIHCDDTGTNISPTCDVEDTTIYGGP